MIKRILIVTIISAIMVVGGMGVALSNSHDHMTNVASSSAGDSMSSKAISNQNITTTNKIISLPLSAITINVNESQGEIEDNIATFFLSWIDSRNITLNIQHHNATKKLFREFVSHNVEMGSFLKILSQVEEKADRKTDIRYNNVITMNQGYAKSLSSNSYVVTQDSQHNHTVIKLIRSNNTALLSLNSSSVSPDTSSSQPFFWVTINYFIFHAPWYLGGWSENYGQNDNFNLYLTGQAAASFNNEWMAVTTYADYALYSLGAIFIYYGASLGGIGVAIGLALIAAGVGFTYEGAQMTSYYEGTGTQYIHLDFINNYYSPLEIVTLGLGSLASSIGLIGVYNNGASPIVFWYNVPFVAYAGVEGVYFSSQLAGFAADFA